MLAWLVYDRMTSGDALTSGLEPRPDRVVSSGFVYRSLDGDEQRFSVKIGELVHRRVKLGPLTVNPVTVVELSEVVMEVNVDLYSLSPREILREALASRGIGMVSRITLQDLALVGSRDARTVIELSAEKLEFRARRSTVRLEGRFTVETAFGERLQANAAEWIEAGLEVQGVCTFRDGEELTRGIGGSFNLENDGHLRMSQPPQAPGD